MEQAAYVCFFKNLISVKLYFKDLCKNILVGFID